MRWRAHCWASFKALALGSVSSGTRANCAALNMTCKQLCAVTRNFIAAGHYTDVPRAVLETSEVGALPLLPHGDCFSLVLFPVMVRADFWSGPMLTLRRVSNTSTRAMASVNSRVTDAGQAELPG
jgi:hypothetical protein